MSKHHLLAGATCYFNVSPELPYALSFKDVNFAAPVADMASAYNKPSHTTGDPLHWFAHEEFPNTYFAIVKHNTDSTYQTSIIRVDASSYSGTYTFVTFSCS